MDRTTLRWELLLLHSSVYGCYSTFSRGPRRRIASIHYSQKSEKTLLCNTGSYIRYLFSSWIRHRSSNFLFGNTGSYNIRYFLSCSRTGMPYSVLSNSCKSSWYDSKYT
ncbi:uncharacterized protein LOC142319866 [Lycorma delicatula]|uniref:uncharacterized protein LOC142319866 n=1 Tax=Lycorma delicatula TaxID=130591 RepID=UPI003F512AD0